MTEAEKVLSIARSYASPIAYLEKATNAYLDEFQKNAGHNNWTKFGRDYDSYMKSRLNGQPWCAMFVSMCIVYALGIARAKELLAGNLFASCTSQTNIFKNKGMYKARSTGYVPKQGDVIMFAGTGGVQKHTGLVDSVVTTAGKKYVYTVEGNTSAGAQVIENGGGVYRKSYLLTSTAIDGFGVLKYSNTQEDELQMIIDDLVKKSGKTEAQVIDCLAYLIKFATPEVAEWEKDGVKYLADAKIITSAREGNQPVKFGEFGIMTERIIAAAKKK